jgi:YD repeat-containing protein
MKELIVALISFTLGYCTAATDVYAQTQYFYGPQGQTVGTAMQSGNTTYFYGPQGQSQGTAMRSGNTTYVYGPQGEAVGTVMAPAAPLVLPNYNTSAPSLTPMYDSIFGR